MCPECQEPLVAFEFEGIEIDRCMTCGGTWLDADELEMMIELAGVQAGQLTRALQSAKAGTHATRRCPRCDRKLYALPLERAAVIELDHCPWGHGLWFDAGEMEAVVTAFAEGEEGVVARFFWRIIPRDSQTHT